MISPDPQSSSVPEWTDAPRAPAEADPLALLDADLADPANAFAAPKLWTRLLAGDAPPDLVRATALHLYPAFGGRNRNALFAKISNLEFEDGRVVFARLYERTRDQSRDPEVLWRRFAVAAGHAEPSLDEALAQPLIEATGFAEQGRWFGHRSGHEAAAVAYAVETGLPTLWAQLGPVLRERHGFPPDAVQFFDLEAAELERNREFLAHLVRRYCDTGWKLYLGRRAAREVCWSWHALSERVESLA